MKFKCKTSMWVSYTENQIIDVEDVQWENMEYQGIVSDIPFFYRKYKIFGMGKVRDKFYLFPDQFEPVG